MTQQPNREIGANPVAAARDAAEERVEAYAPGAPEAVKAEAVRRFRGYLAQDPHFGTIESMEVGGLKLTYAAGGGAYANAFRNSGAAGLLARWRVRRAGAIG